MVDRRDEGDGSEAVHADHRGSGAAAASGESDARSWCRSASRFRAGCRRRPPAAYAAWPAGSFRAAWASAYAECCSTGRSALTIAIASDGRSPGPMPLPGPPPGPMAGAPPPPMPAAPMPPPPPPPMFDEVIVQFEIDKPLIKVAGVPPEEMRFDRYARTWKDSRIVGHERVVPMDQMIAMGYTREKCLEYVQSQDINEFTMEAQLRNPGRFMSTRVGDGVKYGQWYIKADQNGDGQPELRYICTMGEDHEIVSDEEANRVKFALFSCDPISHTIVGDSIADYTEDIQKIKTNMMRGILDSLAESINPKTVVNELMVNLDDALNDDLGAVIRTRGDPSQAVMYTQTPFVGQAALPILELMNDMLSRRTGLTDAAKGLDPKAIQSSTQIGVEAVINGAQERVELVARVLGETGFKDLFIGLYNEIAENPSPPRMLHINGKFIPFDTSTFDASMTVEVNAEPRQGQRHGPDDGFVGDQERSAGAGGSDGFEQPDLRAHGDAEHDDGHADAGEREECREVFQDAESDADAANALGAEAAGSAGDGGAGDDGEGPHRNREGSRSATYRPHADAAGERLQASQLHGEDRRSICRSSICRGSKWASIIMLRWPSWRRS